MSHCRRERAGFLTGGVDETPCIFDALRKDGLAARVVEFLKIPVDRERGRCKHALLCVCACASVRACVGGWVGE